MNDRPARRRAEAFFGGWCTSAQKAKLVALAQLQDQSVNRTLVQLIEEAADRATAAALPLPSKTTQKQNRTQILADSGAVLANTLACP